MHDDKLWVFGGMNLLENGEPCNHMWAYDFYARHWSLIDQKGAIPAARTRACTALHDGKMLVYGYQEDDVSCNSIDLDTPVAHPNAGICL